MQSADMQFVEQSTSGRSTSISALRFFLTIATVIGFWALGACAVSAGSPNEADIVVQFDDHDVVVRSIQFTAPISGLQVIQMSGLDVATATFDWGSAVCSIEGVGCPIDDCFCGGNTYWGYSHWDGSAWQGYAVGASDSVITKTGSIEGWRWGEFGSSQVPAPQAQAVQAALSWLQGEQTVADGSYSGNVGSSAEAMLAIGANRIDADTWRRGVNRPSLLDHVLSNGASYVDKGLAGGIAESGKLAVALNAVDGCWPEKAKRPADYYSPTLGSFSDQAGFLSWAILGTLAMSDTVPPDSVQSLVDLAQPGGGWEWSPMWGVDTNTTALAIQALVAAGQPVSSTAIISAVGYLKSAQIADGGFPYNPSSQVSSASDANSTAYAIQGLLAAGEDPTSPGWTAGGNSPTSYLFSVQLPDGSFAWKKEANKPLESNLAATQQAVVALLGRTFPLDLSGLPSCKLSSTIVTPDTGGQVSASIFGLDVNADFPANVVASASTATIDQVASPTAGGGFHILGRTFMIGMEETSTQLVIELSEPFTVTVDYSNVDMTGVDESKLDLYIWDSQKSDWVATSAVMDLDMNTLTARSTQLATYAVAVDDRKPVYLPSVAATKQ